MYGKVFKEMFTGSMVGIGPVPYALWCYCIANAEPPGVVELNPVLAAAAIGCTRQEIEEAIAKLGEPDPNSRTPDHEGRRLIPVGGFSYEMPSWPKWHAIRRQEDRRAQNREAQRRRRAKMSGSSARQQPSADRQRDSSESAHKDTDADADVEMDGRMDGGRSSQEGVPTGTGTRTGGQHHARRPETGAGATISRATCPNSPHLPKAAHGPARPPHPCPYQAAKGDLEHRCECCAECERRCWNDAWRDARSDNDAKV